MCLIPQYQNVPSKHQALITFYRPHSQHAGDILVSALHSHQKNDHTTEYQISQSIGRVSKEKHGDKKQEIQTLSVRETMTQMDENARMIKLVYQ